MNPATHPAVVTPLDPATLAFLDQVPSETTPGERRLLFNFFRDHWDGAGHIVEIGPFLGGTTRAIALGAARNPRRAPGGLLHTFDKFDAYYSAPLLRSTIEPMVRRGIFTRERADELCATANFERLFEAIHSPHDYAPAVRLHHSPLPDLPEEIDGSNSLAQLADAGPLGAVFVDGCKSWASTHYALKFLLPRLPAGAPVIFQDFGWYTCFWISSAVHALRRYLTLEARVDATYVFRLTRTLRADDVARHLARTPAEMGERFFTKAAATLREESAQSGDLRGELIAQLHLAGALLTIGHRAAAVSVLQGLDVRRYAAFADMIRGCLKSPTYLPGGKQLLWKEAA